MDPGDHTASDRVQREYEVLRVLDDPRIPRVYGIYVNEAAMAMAFADGITLADIIHAAAQEWVVLEPATALDIAIEVAHALRHAHSVKFGAGSRIVHGHLGPQRIRLQPSGGIVVVGLGAAARGRHPAYTPPEVAMGGMPTRASDQWALGATVVQMLLGERLYAGRRSPEDAAREGNVAPWTQRIERQYPELGGAIRKMLAPAPQARFQSEPEMLKALLTASRRMGGTVHRRHLVAQVSIHADKLHAMRPPRPPILPLPLPPNLGPADPEVQHGHAPTPVLAEEFKMSTDNPTPAAPQPVQVNLSLDLDPPATAIDIPIVADVEETDPASKDSAWSSSSSVASQVAPADEPELEPTEPRIEPHRDRLSPPAPEPTAAYLPSEVIGLISGLAMIALGIWYCTTVL